ncbi:MAG TPA: alpha/beta hydrolase [Anaerolineales bacterium]|nr:alpha/beta hydrolase [Anaerolineales bacterium]
MPFAQDIYYAQSPRASGNEGTPPLVLIHGAGGSHLHWPRELRRLSTTDVYALDLPGHGKSEGVGRQSIPAYAERLLEWMKDAWVQRPVLVGHSMGGAIALQAALDARSALSGLVLIGSGARLRVAEALLQSTLSEETMAQAVQVIVDWSYSAGAARSLRELSARGLREMRATVLHNDFVACDGFDVMARLGELLLPVLIVCGSEDRLTPEKYSRYLAGHLPDARLVILPGAGHMAMLEQPQASADAVRAFLQERFGVTATR